MTLSEAKKAIRKAIRNNLKLLDDRAYEIALIILNSPNLSKREFDKYLKELYALSDKIKKAVKDDIVKSMFEYSLYLWGGILTKSRVMKELDQLLNDEVLIYAMTKHGKKPYAYRYVKVFDGLFDNKKKTLQQFLIGVLVSGDRPHDLVKSVTEDKALRRKLQTLTETYLYTLRNKTNLEIIKREFPDSWVMYRTQNDDRVDDVCSECQTMSIREQWKPSDFPESCLPSRHWGCRCSIEPMYGEVNEEDLGKKTLIPKEKRAEYAAKKKEYNIKWAKRFIGR